MSLCERYTLVEKVKDFSTFLVEHLDVIISGLLLIISLVISLLRKRPVTNEEDNVFKKLVLKIPTYIIEAEKTAKVGDEKLAYVVTKSLDFVRGYLLLDQDELDAWSKNITYIVELMLSTPRKKV